MKQYFFIVTSLVIFFSTKDSFAQHKQYKWYDKRGFTHFDTTVNDNYCLELIKQDNKLPILSRYIIKMNQDGISEHIYKPKDEAIKLYGKECVIVVEMKPNIELINLKELFIMFNVPKECRDLPVFVDMLEITHPKTIIAVKNRIKRVEIVSDSENKKLIHIITTLPKDNKPTIN
jgi:hypothetical protein